MKMPNAIRVVTVCSGGRDDYILPIELSKLGYNVTHVTDFYPRSHFNILNKLSLTYSPRRYSDNLELVKIDWPNFGFLWLILTKLFPYIQKKFFSYMEKAVEKTAEKYSAGAIVIFYQGHLSKRANRAKANVLFQYHPHPDYVRKVLDNDFMKHGVCEESYRNELKLSPVASIRENQWQLADFIICNSMFTAQSVVACGANPKRVISCPYPMTSVTRNFSLSINKNLPERLDERPVNRFLFVGQGTQRKGVHLLVKAWNFIAVRFPKIQLTLVLNNCDDSLKKFLYASATNINIKSGLSHEELRNEYLSNDVFIMPSLVEGYGFVYIEAISCGMYIIGSPNSVLPDFFESCGSVEILKNHELETISGAIEEAVKTWVISTDIRLSNSKLVQNYDLKSYSRRLDRIMEMVLSEEITRG